MEDKFSLKEHLFNEGTVSQLAAEFARAVPGFDAEKFVNDCLAGFTGRELLARLEFIADQLETQLPDDFPMMADQLHAAMPPELDPDLTDDDFGHFIHACPGILAVRHGLEDHRARAMTLLYEATKRFSMEFYIRPFINRWPDETMAALLKWTSDKNYHVRRLASEGTRPRLPWAKKIEIDPLTTLPILDALHADPTRYVTRSVANHLNDIAKISPDVVLGRLQDWKNQGRQDEKELAWMSRHALRTLIKDGHAGTMEFLGYRAGADVTVHHFQMSAKAVKIGDVLEFEVMLDAPTDEPVILDYILHLRKSKGETAPKVFKLKDYVVSPGGRKLIKKKHRFKGDATTFTLHPGPQKLQLQVNGRVIHSAEFELLT